MSEWGVHSAMLSPKPSASCRSLRRTIAGIFSSIEHESKGLQCTCCQREHSATSARPAGYEVIV
jgi:hypothetical protein